MAAALAWIHQLLICLTINSILSQSWPDHLLNTLFQNFVWYQTIFMEECLPPGPSPKFSQLTPPPIPLSSPKLCNPPWIEHSKFHPGLLSGLGSLKISLDNSLDTSTLRCLWQFNLLLCSELSLQVKLIRTKTCLVTVSLKDFDIPRLAVTFPISTSP